MTIHVYQVGRKDRVDVYWAGLDTATVKMKQRTVARIADRAELARGVDVDAEGRSLHLKLPEGAPLDQLVVTIGGRVAQRVGGPRALDRVGGALVFLALILFVLVAVSVGTAPDAFDLTLLLTSLVEPVTYLSTGLLTLFRGSRKAAWIALGVLVLSMAVLGLAPLFGQSFALFALLLRFAFFSTCIKALSEA